MVLLYHNIDNAAGHNTVSLQNFTGHIEFLVNQKKYKIVSLNEYVNNLHTVHKKHLLAITFDDAYVNVLDMALPVLEKHNIPFTIFVPANFAGKYNAWDGDRKRINICSWSQMRAMNNHPLITFGSHGLNHFSMAHIDDNSLKSEFKDSKSILEKEIREEISFFAYPFGQLEHRNKKDPNLLKECGYKAAFTTNLSIKNSLKNRYALNRININQDWGLKKFITLFSNKNAGFYKQVIKNLLYRAKKGRS